MIEDLRIQNLTRPARGTAKDPGSNVRAKAGLDRSILGMAWGKTEHMLGYKCPMHAGVLIRTNLQNSSIQCAKCGHRAPNSLSQAAFRCVACRHAANPARHAAGKGYADGQELLMQKPRRTTSQL